MSLSGKRVLITGGGSGAGANLARGFAAAGAEVVIAGRRMAALESVVGPGIRAVQADVTDEDTVARLVSRMVPRWYTRAASLGWRCRTR